MILLSLSLPVYLRSSGWLIPLMPWEKWHALQARQPLVCLKSCLSAAACGWETTRRRLRRSRTPVSLDGRSWRDSRRNCVRNLPWKILGNHQHSEQQLFHSNRRRNHWWVSLSAPTPMQIENGAEMHSKNQNVTCTEYMTLMHSAGPMK